MDQLNHMFYHVKDSELQGASVDEKMLTILDHKGVLQRTPVIDERWIVLSFSCRYQPYPVAVLCGPGASADKKTTEFLNAWRDAARVYCDELTKLLNMTYDRFWCHALFRSDQLLHFLRSFLMHGTRSFDLVAMSKDDLSLHSRISGLVFICVLTLCCNRRTKHEHISPKRHAAFLQKFIKLPFLFDMCALYGQEGMRHEFLKKILFVCFKEYRRLLTEIRNGIRDLGDTIFHLWEEKFCGTDEMSVPSLEGFPSEDLVLANGYICDITCSLQRFVRAVAGNTDIIAAIRDAKLAARLIQLGNTVIWNINKEICNRLNDSASHIAVELDSLRKAHRQGMLIEFAIVDVFRQLELLGLVSDPVVPQDMQKAWAILFDVIPQNKRFAILYEKWTPIGVDVSKAKSSGKLDESVLDRLAHYVKEAFHSEKLQWDYAESGKQQRKESVPLKTKPPLDALTQKAVSFSVNDDHLETAAQEIMGLLGDSNINYVKACLKHFNMDKDKAVDAILSGDVPVSLSEHIADVTSSEPSVPILKPSGSSKGATTSATSAAPFGNMPNLQGTRSGVVNPGNFIEKVYYGKRDSYEEIEEGGVPDDTKAITIAMARVYDDEYDDTYDDIEADDVMRLNDRIDLVENELKRMGKDKDSSEEVSEDEATPAQRKNVPQGMRPQQRQISNRGDPQGARGQGNFRGRGRPPRAPRGNQRVQHDEEPAPEMSAEARQARAAQLNDVWVAQMAQNFEAQTNRRNAGPGNAPRGNSEQQVQKNKEQNKAHYANHNRKGRGQWKRSQGMY
ncbi:activating signal cointegrator 1 complex subunit 2-like [Paramacrobiotus metropolitanus]|uniref:activating signal cointegrator 1 complex subunit 2-like n=1 Tax=Paramacrobiotus metropolitanus TaxID=2943436 RepID=UPI002446236E|nr:activating signal cointegrator 1 complex subunit 2-like [Paramacrobiotus metropolitanus]XP_055335106.1 activating signal cointegrator 1 complex subunit 2-like [Paramacrobiotus metropolitanus]XP_055335107.1 activating signal cointegrator 1 complex subunit 2-like [Paramacrobiotus metropolitanus]